MDIQATKSGDFYKVTLITVTNSDVVLLNKANKGKEAYIEFYASLDNENYALIFSKHETADSSMYLLCIPAGIRVLIKCNSNFNVTTNQ